MPTSHPLSITTPAQNAALSAAQRKFNQLLKKIDANKARLQMWQDGRLLLQQRVVSDLHPLLEKLLAQRKALTLLLDKHHASIKLAARDKKRLAQVILTLVEASLAADDDEALKVVYARHAGSDFDEDVAQEKAMAKEMLESLLGINLDEATFDQCASPEDMLRAAFAQKQQEQAAQANTAPPEPPKSKRQIANEAKREQAEKEISQSVRAVYRQLAATLHPDREPDEGERQRKTALMQRVNTAYDAGDLLGLLNLQLEIEQIDQAHLNTLSTERLKHYIKVLTDQEQELRHELLMVEQHMAEVSGMKITATTTPGKLMARLEQDMALQAHLLKKIDRDLRFLGDPRQPLGAAQLKSWLEANYDGIVADE